MLDENIEKLIPALTYMVVLSIFLERALAVLFEWRAVRDWIKQKMLRAPIAYLVALLICILYNFDALSIIFSESKNHHLFGYFLTAGVIAGGSKGAILLFQGILGFGHQSVSKKVKEKSGDA